LEDLPVINPEGPVNPKNMKTNEIKIKTGFENRNGIILKR